MPRSTHLSRLDALEGRKNAQASLQAQASIRRHKVCLQTWQLARSGALRKRKALEARQRRRRTTYRHSSTRRDGAGACMRACRLALPLPVVFSFTGARPAPHCCWGVAAWALLRTKARRCCRPPCHLRCGSACLLLYVRIPRGDNVSRSCLCSLGVTCRGTPRSSRRRHRFLSLARFCAVCLPRASASASPLLAGRCRRLQAAGLKVAGSSLARA